MTRLNLDLNSEQPVIYLFLSNAVFPIVSRPFAGAPTENFDDLKDLSVNSRIRAAIYAILGRKTWAKDKKPAAVSGGLRTIWKQAD